MTYTRNKTDVNVDILLTKRRLYRKAKRRARYKFNLDQKPKLNNLAKSKPQQFWKEIKTIRIFFIKGGILRTF